MAKASKKTAKGKVASAPASAETPVPTTLAAPKLFGEKHVATAEPAGGTQIGWSFYSSFERCRRLWFLRYVLQMYPREVAWELAVGTVYHALMEGISLAEIHTWGEIYIRALPLAQKLHEHRTKKGPPLGTVVSKEQVFEVEGKNDPLAGKYTSKPDRIEQSVDVVKMYASAEPVDVSDGPPAPPITAPRIVREFKTAATLRDTDDVMWRINGEVIGEMVTSGLKEVVVDIISKFEQPSVSQIQVELTPVKERAWRGLVEDAVMEVELRLFKLLRELKERDEKVFLEDSPLVDTAGAFPRRLNECVSYSGRVCDYYKLCWQNETGSARGDYIKKSKPAPWAARLGVGEVLKDVLSYDVRTKVSKTK